MTQISNKELTDLLKMRNLRNRTRKAVGKFFLRQFTYVVGTLFGGWMFMLAVGIAHAEWVPKLPTIGYWWAVLLVYILRGTFSRIESTDKDE